MFGILEIVVNFILITYTFHVDLIEILRTLTTKFE